MRPTRDVAPLTVRFDGAAVRAAERQVAVETPVNVLYGGIPYAVMMMTPADIEDFAVGFSVTEGIIGARQDIRRISVQEDPDGVRLLIELAPDRLHALLVRRRAMHGRTSCGVCGIEDLADLPRATRRPAARVGVAAAAIRGALAGITEHQVLNAGTRAMHAAAWSDSDGRIACVREDVGRHNALDKLIGALACQGTDPERGFLLITSRCSYEMVEKAAAFGAGVLVAISAPTSLGISRALEHGITLVGIARPDALTVFSVPERIQVEVPA
jgi:FdhD protein